MIHFPSKRGSYHPGETTREMDVVFAKNLFGRALRKKCGPTASAEAK
jgi:hypothetical protein